MMALLNLLRHPILLSGVTLPEFVQWYFFVQPKKIVQSYFAYFRAFLEIFSFVFLLRTLFAPWKQISEALPSKGFNIGLIAQAFTLNMVSRTIGLLFRTCTICIGIFFLFGLTFVFATFLVIWLTFPLLFWVGLTYFFALIPKLL